MMAVLLFSFSSVRMKVLSFWELHTGKYVTTVSVSDENRVTETRVSRTQALLDHADEIEKQSIEDWKKMHAMRQEKKEMEQNEQMVRSVEVDAWDAVVSGYLESKTEKCPSWEECNSRQVAWFVVPKNTSEKLSQYLDTASGSMLRVPIGCLESGRIRFIAYDNLRSKKYDFLTGEDFRVLKESNADHLVTLSFTKPYYPDAFGTEGLICMTPFVDFHVATESVH